MLRLDSFPNPILKKSTTLIKIRLCVTSFAFAHLLIVSNWLLAIDFSKATDPYIRTYENTRWKLITTWFNLLTFIYHPTSLYCDWKELKGQSYVRHVIIMNRARHLLFTGILLPTTSFGDILFWRVWNKNRELIAPEAVDVMVPLWTQHCMHTVSLILILMDLIMVPRERPKSMAPGAVMLTTFLTLYIFVCVQSFLNEEYIYPGLKYYTGMKFPILVAYIYIENFFYYTSQWLIIDMVWGNPNAAKMKKID